MTYCGSKTRRFQAIVENPTGISRRVMSIPEDVKLPCGEEHLLVSQPKPFAERRFTGSIASAGRFHKNGTSRPGNFQKDFQRDVRPWTLVIVEDQSSERSNHHDVCFSFQFEAQPPQSPFPKVPEPTYCFPNIHEPCMTERRTVDSCLGFRMINRKSKKQANIGRAPIANKFDSRETAREAGQRFAG